MNKTDRFVSINLDIKPDSKLKAQKWNFDLVVKFVQLEAKLVKMIFLASYTSTKYFVLSSNMQG